MKAEETVTDDRLYEQMKVLFEKNAFAKHNHMSFLSVSPGTAECALDLQEDSMNPYGIAHGGTYFSLADMAAGMAVRTDGRRHVTQTVSGSYLRAATNGRLICKAQVVHAGRRTSLCETKVYDEQGKLCFTGQYTYFCIE